VLIVSGVDLLDMTPIYDIKPYLPLADCRTDATGGYSEAKRDFHVKVVFPDELLMLVPENKRDAVIECLAEDPRPAYQQDPQRVYHLVLKPFEVHFRVEDKLAVVTAITPYAK
jgi:hypothetical protein